MNRIPIISISIVIFILAGYFPIFAKTGAMNPRTDYDEILLDETFDNNQKDWWEDKIKYGEVKLLGGKYQMESYGGSLYSSYTASIDTTKDFCIEIEVEIDSKSLGNNYFRIMFGAKNKKFGYDFRVSSQGRFAYGEVVDNYWHPHLYWKDSPYIQPSNKIQVTKKGDRLDFFINGNWVGNTFFNGSFGKNIILRVDGKITAKVDSLIIAQTDPKMKSDTKSSNVLADMTSISSEEKIRTDKAGFEKISLLHETFDDNKRSWRETDEGGTLATVADGKYYLYEKEGQLIVSQKLDYFQIEHDFCFDVEMDIESRGLRSDYFGMTFWYDEINDNGYEFRLSPPGEFSFGRVEWGHWIPLINWQKTSHFKKHNLMRARSINGKVYLYLNGYLLGKVATGFLPGQDIGFRLNGNLRVDIDSIQVSQTTPWYKPVSSMTRSLKEWPIDLTKLKSLENQEIVFEDGFKKERSNWFQINDDKSEFTLKDQRYFLTHKYKTQSTISYYPVGIDEQNDFSMTTRITKLSGTDDNGASWMWGRADYSNYYKFSIAGKGYFRIAKKNNGRWIDFVPWTYSRHIRKKNSTNDLKIEKTGQQLQFFINAQPVAILPYEHMFGDQIGFELDQNISIAIDKVIITQAKLSDKPYVQLNTGGHTSKITHLQFTHDNKLLVSVSKDKTARIWDIETGKCIRVLRGEIDHGNYGKIYAAALSPDNRTLAVGGWLGPSKNFTPIELGTIRLFDIYTGEVEGTLRGLKYAILDLKFSQDGQYLLSISPKGANLYKMPGGKLLYSLTGHTDELFSGDISSDGKRIVIAGQDKTLRLYQGSDGRLIRVMQGQVGSIIRESAFSDAGKIGDVAFTKDGKYIVSGSKLGHLRLWNGKTGELIKSMGKLNGGITAFSISPDGNKLITGVDNIKNDGEVYIIGTKQIVIEQAEFIGKFSMHTNNVYATAISANGMMAATAGGEFGEIHIWDLESSELIHTLKGKGNVVRNVGIKGDIESIAWGLNQTVNNIQIHGSLKSSLSFKDSHGKHRFSKTKPKKRELDKFNRALRFVNDIAFDTGLLHTTRDEILKIFKDGQLRHNIEHNAGSGGEHLCATLTPDGKAVISGGSFGHIYAYNVKTGVRMRHFIGHTDDVWTLAVSENGKWLVSGAADQTIKIWNMVTGELLISFFFGLNDEWVAWTPGGYYDASVNGDNLIGWQVNHGFDKKASFYTARQFRRYLYRPEILRDSLKLGSSLKALEQAGLSDITVNELVKRAPVDVRITDYKRLENNEVLLTVKLANNTTTAPERATIYINGAQVLSPEQRKLKALNPGNTVKFKVPLFSKNNHVRLTMENRWAESFDEMNIELPNWSNEIHKSGNLYIAAVGINRFPSLPRAQNLATPNLDAISMALKFKQLEGRLYKKVDANVLIDSVPDSVTLETNTSLNVHLQKTTQGIKSANVCRFIENIVSKAKANDTILVFLAGHGVTDNAGNYHFITANSQLDSVYESELKINNSFDWKQLHELLDQTYGKRLVFVDTCQAGTVIKSNRTDINRLIKDIHDLNAVIYTGTSQQQLGLETTLGGVFTRTILDGLNGGAGYSDNQLLFSSLQKYVDKEVVVRNQEIWNSNYRGMKLVKNKKDNKQSVEVLIQNPVSVIPEGMNNLVIYAK